MMKSSKRKAIVLTIVLTMICSCFIENKTVYADDGMGVKEVVTFGQSSYVIKTDGTLWVAGRNDRGQLGVGTTSNVTTKAQVLTDVSKVVLGMYDCAYAIKTDGSLWVTGDNLDGQLGDMRSYYGKITTWKQVLTGVSQVATAGANAYVLKIDGTLWVAGNNLYGILGDGTAEIVATWKQVLTNVSQIVATNSHSAYVLKKDGSLWVAGNNSYGQLGDGTTTNVNTWKQVLTGVSQIVYTRDKMFVLKTDGTLWGAGLNSSGELGDGTITNVKTWKKLLSGVKLVQSNYYNTFVLKTDGTLWATGKNDYGQLGVGTTTDIKTWKQVLTGVSKFGGYGYSTYAVKTNGTLWITGFNSKGELGDGTTTDVKAWKQVMTDVDQVLEDSSCAYVIKKDGTLWVTGSNSSGQLGDGTITKVTTWKPILTEVKKIIGVSGDAYAIKTDGTLWVTGNNKYGQLGDGTTTNILSWCPSEAKKLSSIAVTTPPTKATYIEGENFDAAGMVVTATYNNGTTAVVNGTVDNGDNLTTETNSITIRYTEDGITKTVTQPITVTPKLLSSIEITKAPDKTVYFEGENFDVAGMIVMATYEDGSTTAVNGVVTNGTALAKGTDSVTVSYTKNGVTKTAVQPITVNAKQLISIAVTTAPTKATYTEGENFDATGMVVTATYSNDTTAIITGTADNGNSLTVGMNSVNISYTENGVTKITTQPIIVNAKKLVSIAITTAPTKTEYVEGENFDTTGMVITATYNNGMTAVILETVNDGSNLAAGTTSVAISYTEGGTTQTILQSITVSSKSLEQALDLNCVQGKELLVPFYVMGASHLNDVVFTLQYEAANLEVIDLVSQTKKKEISIGIVNGTGIEILSYTPGEIKFRVNKEIVNGKTWSGNLNIFKFKAKITGNTSFITKYN
ncbi:bacterial Ig-like domain-containing protein [Clostridium aminobutyricum]|uniref:Bacterial Ig-like domain-containing protein n=1 Tax=Clostridium aminobutyricum TaxID=33953 RepID=A0A939D9K4_CLOAM|nr:bacterial Ig-like domain-containing protein [Clostridium aminobutyricum]MBN7773731.1 bacterial Ig-like domain-containing protein [Clostridium aminobutyricum]